MSESRSTLATTLTQLLGTATGLTSDALEHRGDPAVRADAVHDLDERLTALQAEMEAAPDRTEVEPIWWEIKRNLIFLQATSTVPADPGNPNALAGQLNNEVYNLVEQMIAGGQGGRIATGDRWTGQAESLQARLLTLTREEGNVLEPDARRQASEALLELDFVLKGGQGATSPRVAQLLRDAQAGTTETR
jgi:hypothetical protein